MSVTAIRPPTDDQRHPFEAPARRSITPSPVAPGRLDRVWWPHSRDLAAELPTLPELPALLREFGSRGHVTRATVADATTPGEPLGASALVADAAAPNTR